MGEYVPAFNFETLPDGTPRVTDNSIQDAVFDAMKRLADAKEAALKEAIKSLGWIAPEDIAAHDARIASEATERALREAADDLEGVYFGPDQYTPFSTGAKHKWGAIQSAKRLRERADRIRAEREGAGEGC